MMALCPTTLLNGVAIHDPDDPHLAPGGHLRLIPHPALGLPIAPLVLRKNVIDPRQLAANARTEITWLDANGNQLFAPFTMRAGMVVTGHLPPGSRCLWIEVDASPSGMQLLPLPRSDRGNVAPSLSVPRLDRPLPLRPDLIASLSRAVLQVAHIEPSVRGDAVTQSRSAAPYALAASRILRVRITGSGVVRGVRWLDEGDLVKENLYAKEWRRWSLPVGPAPRYAAPARAMDDAKARIRKGAPLRQQMPDAPAATPATAPSLGATAAARATSEFNRVTKRVEEGGLSTAATDGSLAGALKRLVSDLSAPAAELSMRVDSFDEQTGKPVGHVDVNLLSALQMAQLDPGMARWLGLADTDAEVTTMAAGSLVIYWVEGFWEAPNARESMMSRIMARLAEKQDDLRKAFNGLIKDDVPKGVAEVMRLRSVIPLLVGQPPARPQPPVIGAPRSGEWTTDIVPPDAARQITLPLSRLLPGGPLAFARLDGGAPRSLHEKGPDGTALPLLAAELPDAAEPGQGELFDRLAPPGVVQYRVAQADWFGRWSEWRQVQAPTAERPLPPRPVPEMFYILPDVSGVAPETALPGEVNIRVGIPQPAQLAPGSLAIETLELTLNAATQSIALDSLPSGSTEVDVTVPGPPLALGGEGLITLTARWIDSAQRAGQPSQPIERRIFDPRPPVGLTMPQALAYGSRPDVTGKSRIALTWTPAIGGMTYRIYQSDETALIRSLVKRGGHAALLASIAAATDAPSRAELFVDNKALFGRDQFGLVNPDDFTQTQFEHRVSGSLRVLVFYRVLPVSTAGVEADFASSALLPFAIPNSGPPAPPMLTVRPVRDANGVLRPSIAISVARGAVAAREFRLRRSPSESRDPLRMPIVHAGLVPPLDASAGPDAQQHVTSFFDTGGDIAPFNTPIAMWSRYSWAAEVRGGPEPGSATPGEWSDASAVVSLALAPDAPPAPLAAGRLESAAAGTTAVSFHHAEPLQGGALGEYSIDLYRARPGEPLELAASSASEAARSPDPAGGFRFVLRLPETLPPGTRLVAMVVDPAGRSSAPSTALIVP